MIDGNMSKEDMIFCESAAVTLRAFHRSGVGAGDKLFIYGIGLIGLLIAQLAKAAGVKSIVLVDGAGEKVGLAQKMGFTAVFVRQEKLSDVMDAAKGVDACIECTGKSEGLAECVGHVKAGGIVVCVGVPTEDVDFSRDTYLGIRQKELTLVGVSTENAREMEEWEEAVTAVREGRLDLKHLVGSMLDYEKKVLKDFDEFLTDCWKNQRSDETNPIYKAVMEKKRNNDAEIWQAIRIGLMMGFSSTQEFYRKQVLDKLK